MRSRIYYRGKDDDIDLLLWIESFGFSKDYFPYVKGIFAGMLSSFDGLLRKTGIPHFHRHVITIMDARRQEVFAKSIVIEFRGFKYGEIDWK